MARIATTLKGWVSMKTRLTNMDADPAIKWAEKGGESSEIIIIHLVKNVVFNQGLSGHLTMSIRHATYLEVISQHHIG